MTNYRRVWTEAYGPIPTDFEGRPYHIHHIDNDRRNNDLDNLQLLSAWDHFELHLSCGDTGAAFKLAQLLRLDYATTHGLMLEANAKRRGVPRPKNECEKISKSMRGKRQSAEHRANSTAVKIGRKRGSWYHSPDGENGMFRSPPEGWLPGRTPIARTGKYRRTVPMSEETKRKLSISLKKSWEERPSPST